MVKRLFLVVLLVLATGCASSLPPQIPETMKAACRLYLDAKPDVLAAREWAKAHWSEIPADVKPVLLKLDGYLPELDAVGQLLCAASVSLDSLSASNVDWDDVLSTVLKAVGFALELKKTGAI